MLCIGSKRIALLIGYIVNPLFVTQGYSAINSNDPPRKPDVPVQIYKRRGRVVPAPKTLVIPSQRVFSVERREVAKQPSEGYI